MTDRTTRKHDIEKEDRLQKREGSYHCKERGDEATVALNDSFNLTISFPTNDLMVPSKKR